MLTHVEHGDDARVGQAAGGAGFAVEALAELLALLAGQYQGNDGLQGDDAIHRRVLGAIDRAHGAMAQFGEDLVTPDLFGRIHKAGTPILLSRRGLYKSSRATQDRRGQWGARQLLGEALDRFRLVSRNAEDAEQPRNPQQVVELGSETAQAQGRTAGLGAVMNTDQCAQAGTIDELHLFHIENQFLFVFGQQVFHFVAEAGRCLAQHDVAVQSHYGNAADVAARDLKGHAGLSGCRNLSAV